MKRITAILLVVLTVNSTFATRAWWATAIVDGAGAFGGACTGSPYFPPWGAIAGGILCGAGASLSKAPGHSNNLPPSIPVNALNNLDNSGAIHNNLVRDFAASKISIADQKATAQFLITKSTEYGVKTDGITVDLVVGVVSGVTKIDFTTNNGVIKYMAPNLPLAFQSKLKASLDKLSNSVTIGDFNKMIVGEETALLSDTSLDVKAQNAMKSFFAVLRYSANYWAANLK